MGTHKIRRSSWDLGGDSDKCNGRLPVRCIAQEKRVECLANCLRLSHSHVHGPRRGGGIFLVHSPLSFRVSGRGPSNNESSESNFLLT